LQKTISCHLFLGSCSRKYHETPNPRLSPHALQWLFGCDRSILTCRINCNCTSSAHQK
jgi:hypothetical protein